MKELKSHNTLWFYKANTRKKLKVNAHKRLRRLTNSKLQSNNLETFEPVMLGTT